MPRFSEPVSGICGGRAMKKPFSKWWDKWNQLFAEWSLRARAFIFRKPVSWEQALSSLRWLQEANLLRADTLAMLEGIWRISDIRAKDIMVPRPSVVAISQDAKLNDIVKIITDSGHSRFPIIGNSLDNISGILLAKDLLQYLGSEDKFDINNHIRQVAVVPESKRLNVLLDEFRRNRNHMAAVVDEYGGVCGLITLEDVLEQIVGEISDEHDLAEDHYVYADDKGRYIVKAMTPLEYFNRFFSSTIKSKSADTVGGIIIETLGRMPKCEEKILIKDIAFEVFQADQRRIYSLIVRQQPTQ